MVQGKEDTEQLPAWLDQQMFEEFIERDFPNLKKIKSFQLEPSAGKGENYTTLLLRANFELELKDGSQQSISYMAKVLPNSGNRDNVASWKVFDKERQTYGQYIPEFEQMYREAGKEITFGPRYYEAKNQPEEELIVLEDLGKRGFKNVDRQGGLDILHTEAILEKLAQFHAASAVRFELKGAYPAEYDRNLCSQEDSFKDFRDTQTKAFVEAFPLYEASDLAKDVESFGSQAEDMFQAYAPQIEGEFRVLNHGDAWCNNFMFQHDESGKLLETYFVDLQMSRFSSPAQDLLYFILSSTQLDIKIAKFDHLIMYYHGKLTESLKLLKYPKPLPSLRSLHQSIFTHGDWILPIISLLLPIVLVDSSDDANMDSLMDSEGAGDKFRNNLLQNPRIIRHQKVILPWAHCRGAFEVTK
ncbi:uncharacterized protein LOC119548482 [Drosophila subpulchrella]|uniref:uncharacterized protein LOC119548482 n=1 Tax=Drosophila subpulchrella TaxID=1486046 RepID=UPI0018A199C5|nr:uncharacterized protein LOC119548482 [Drosophila subpulchrella]